MSRDLSQAFITGMSNAFSDLKFVVQHDGVTREFLVNKIVLAARSEYFRKLFASDPKLREIPVKGVPPREFRRKYRLIITSTYSLFGSLLAVYLLRQRV